MQPSLQRSLSFPLMLLYGLGTTIGAGIYALTGEVAGRAGMGAPFAFLIATFLAGFTALSFAELASRHPQSAGEAVYVREGLGTPRVATAVGLLVALAGSVSAATVLNGFVGYLGELVAVPRAFAIVACTLALGGIAAWGIRQSVMVAGAMTLLEIGGLVLVVAVARGALAELPERWPEIASAASPDAWRGLLGAGILAFYAFLGFEDMVNVAEEVKGVRRTLPLAIVAVLLLTAVLYFALALTCVLAVPPRELAASGAPLALVYERSTGGAGTAISAIGILAMLNGALVQVVMAARVLYGLAEQGSIPAPLARVNARTRTPLLATAAVVALVTTLALGLPLAPLAEITSVLALVVFALVNLSLWRLKRREPRPPGVWLTPAWVPVAGFAASLGFLVLEAAL